MVLKKNAKHNNSFGATTLRSRHAKLTGKNIRLKYKAKSGKQREVNITDKVLSLERARDRGEIRVSDPKAAAALLMDMLHLPLIDALVDPNFRPETEAWRQRFELGLSVFLRGIS